MDSSVFDLIAYWVPQDPWLKTRLENHLPMSAGLTLIGSEYLPWKTLEHTDFYNECGRQVGIKGLITLILEDEVDDMGCHEHTSLLPERTACQNSLIRTCGTCVPCTSRSRAPALTRQVAADDWQLATMAFFHCRHQSGGHFRERRLSCVKIRAATCIIEMSGVIQ